MNFPENVKYSTDHEWVRVEGSEAYVGITDFAQDELGEIVFVDITTQGDALEQGEVFGSIEAVKTGGEVLEINPKLDDAPELVNKDPFGEGWIIKITVQNAEELSGLMSADAYKAFVGK